MPAGGPGDDPIGDILHWRRPVVSFEVDLLIAEVMVLGDLAAGTWVRAVLNGIRSGKEMQEGTTPTLLAQLEAKRDLLLRRAKSRGYDLDLAHERIATHRAAITAAYEAQGPG